MAQIVYTDVKFTINSVDLSDRTMGAVLNHDADQIEVTAMSDTAHKYVGGLENISATIELQQDFATGESDPTIEALIGTTTTYILQPTSAVVGTDNPTFTVSDALVASYQPINAGAPGELGTFSLELVGGTLVRATS
jgi:hypothetical protein